MKYKDILIILSKKKNIPIILPHHNNRFANIKKERIKNTKKNDITSAAI